jgi:thymidylate synthase (FAD)
LSNVKYVPMEVQYVDHMGSDINVVNAARVSFAKEVSEFDLEKDTKLINYLAKHNHWSPLAHTSITIRVKAPIFMARQFVKHQIGLVWNEESRRYIDTEPEFYKPNIWRSKPENAKQGSGNDVVTHVRYETSPVSGLHKDIPIEEIYDQLVGTTLGIYNMLLEANVAPEQARMVLPQSVMTNWIWTGSLVAFARICKLRLDNQAQKEAQELAQKIHDVVAPIYPVSWKALMEHMKV